MAYQTSNGLNTAMTKLQYIWTRIQGIIGATLCMVGICMLFSACVSERMDDGLRISDKDGKLLELTLIPHTEQIPTTTLRSHVGNEEGDKDNGLYGVDILNENKIDNIELFVFDPATGRLIGHYTPLNQETITGGSKAAFTISKDDYSKIDGRELEYISVVNAKNPIPASISTKEALYNVIQEDKLSPAPDATGKITPQEKFLMDGVLKTTVSWGRESRVNLGTIELYRATAKIRLRIGRINVMDHQNGEATEYVIKPESSPEVCLIRYLEKTKIVRASTPYSPADNDWHNSSYRPMAKIDYTALGYKNSEESGIFWGVMPFYAYEYDWSDNPNNETYLRLKLTMRPKSAKETDPWIDYYYRIPVNYRKALGEVTDEMLHKLERNHLYDIVSDVEVLGSLSEDIPVDIAAHIAINPWNLIETIDGDLLDAQYLQVYNKTPLMVNTDKVTVPYASSLPVEIVIDAAWYDYYDMRGIQHQREYTRDGSTLYKIVNGGKELVSTKPNDTPWDGIVITPSKAYLSDGAITIQHPVPDNYIPYNFKFTVKQKGGLLSETVTVLQYPNRYVSGEYSKAFRNGTEQLVDENGHMTPVYADFRYHSTIGIFGIYQGETTSSPQVNEVNFKITTLVPKPGERIGSPVDPATGKTKTDPISNQLISPQFIIASQHGMSAGTYQRPDDVPQEHKQRFGNQPFSADYPHYDPWPHYGPWSDFYWGSHEPYYSPANYNQGVYLHDNRRDYAIKQPIKGSCLDAETQCYEYFEGEFGTVGNYTEYYNIKWQQDYYGRRDITWQTRTIHKEFKYQGRWRIPTSAEMKLIDKMQRDKNTEIEGLLFGTYYWVAEEGKVYDFKNQKIIPVSDVPTYYDDVVGMRFPKVYVRPIFDTYMYEGH